MEDPSSSAVEREMSVGQVFGGAAAEEAEGENVQGIRGFLGGRKTSSKENVQVKKFGTVLGVFIPCLQNILGSIYFLRLSWIVGTVGVQDAMVTVGLCCATTFLTSLSLSAIATNGAIKGGGPYYLISRALGPEFGGSVGLCFYLGTTASGAMYILAVAETLLQTWPSLRLCALDGDVVNDPIGINSMRLFGAGVLIISVLCVLAGVKYVSRISPFFLIFVLLSVLSILIGLFASSAARELSKPCASALACAVGAAVGDEDGGGSGSSLLLDAAAENATTSCPPMAGITGLSGVTLRLNWRPPLIPFYEKMATCPPSSSSAGGSTTCDKGEVYGLRYAFALFFPSVTGIMAGSNRSADLDDAQRSIPTGTIAATLATSLLYIGTAFMWGCAVERDALAANQELAALISLPSPTFVRIGVILSSLGAGLQSLTGAPRLLQAIANDNLMPILQPFQGSGEPRRALAFTFALCTCAVSLGNINLIAPIITMFFLICYLFVNLACLLQDVLREPNWRPRFRLYHPLTSFLGVGLCVFIMFFTNPFFALAAIVCVALLYIYISFKKVEAQWGDGLRGLRYERARRALQELETLSGGTHTRNWRPQVLLFCKVHEGLPQAPLAHPKLLALLGQLKGGRGLCILGSIVNGRLAKDWKVQKKVDRSLRRQRDEAKVPGFAQVVMCADVDQGLGALIQTAGLGGLAPNTVMVGWSRHWREHMSEKPRRMVRILEQAHAYNMALIVCKGFDHVPDAQTRLTRPIDIWWVVHDGGLQLLLTTILRKARVWSSCPMRVFCVIQAHEDPDTLEGKVSDFLFKMRIDAIVRVVVLTEGYDAASFNPNRASDGAWKLRKAMVSTLAEGDWAGGTSVTFGNVEDPRSTDSPAPLPPSKPSASLRRRGGAGSGSGGQAPGSPMQAATDPATIITTTSASAAAAGGAAEAAEEGGATRNSPLREASVSSTTSSSLTRNTSAVRLEQLFSESELSGQEAKSRLPSSSSSSSASASQDKSASGPERKGGTAASSSSSRPGDDEPDDDMTPAARWERTMWTTRVMNRLILKYSEASSLVMTNLPIPGVESRAQPEKYMEQVDQLTQDVPFMLLVAGVNDLETITMHS